MNRINIYKNITDLRKKAGVTQEQLATALNISSQAVSKWETNTCQPNIMTLLLIADYFHISISDNKIPLPYRKLIQRLFRTNIIFHTKSSR